MSAASFQSLPTFSHTTTYLPVTSFGVGALVFKLKVLISRAAEGPNRAFEGGDQLGQGSPLACPAYFHWTRFLRPTIDFSMTLVKWE